MLQWLKFNTEATRRRLQEEVKRFKNRDFMRSVAAGCALVASADGTISAEEQEKMTEHIQESSELSLFGVEQVVEYFNQMAEKLALDHEQGKIEAMGIIGRLHDNGDAARTMIRLCCSIGASDGNFDANERRMVREICRELDIDPIEFDL